ncbi:hypothetical protein CYLTODRAFT_379842 [Cylindrobasidium torrendii FP15055 ss-10]|uniref:HD/PDEase domain-containing protein n=1 Tax=Cylindrobasidium torrendii FP15055 ss-10 TaxID=1314674 RepID=A0A0D7B4Q1_9AGAR|nr:hypothetical protein CYLTODRAFT_379842 [Cylindrobasidium torrendii FP15055 ss-10]
MYPTTQEAAVVAKAEALMVETMARYDPSHDAYHVQRVRKTAMSIARALPDQPDLLVVELGALLHDIVDKKYVSAEVAADPYAFFLPNFESWAKETGLDLVADGRARTIAQIVDNVSWSTEKKRRAAGEWGSWHDTCVELHCVQDADRLDAIGAFGILRCAAYTAVTSSPLYTDANDPALPQSGVQHFYDKLVHIHQRLKTEPGRAMGEARHTVILNFLQAIEQEAQCVIPS